MSQAGILDIVSNTPSIPTVFDADTGSATPVANVLNIFGGTDIHTTGAGNTITIAFTGGSGFLQTLTGNSGGAVSPTAGNINTVGTGSITIIGTPGTSTLTTELTGLTNHSVQVGAGTPTLTQLTVGTNGQVLIGATAADPAFATLTSSDGSISFTTGANSLSLQVTGGTSVGKTITGNSGGALSPTAGNWNIFGASTAAGTSPVTTSGSVSTLTVNVQKSQAIASTDATKIGLAAFNSANFSVDANGFVTALSTGTLSTLTGNTGGAISPTAGNINIITAHTNVVFAGASSTLTEDFGGDANGNLSIGSALPNLSSGVTNTVFASRNTGIADYLLSTGSANTFIGYDNGQKISTGQANTLVGQSAGNGLTTSASFNILIGSSAGANYTSTESSNIIIGSLGTLAESHIIRIGRQGSGNAQQNTCFIAGIASVAVSNTNMVTIDTTTGQLGSQAVPAGTLTTLTGNSGGAISPTAGNINTLGTGSITIAGSGSTLTTQLTGLTNHNVQVGAGTATLTQVAPSATSGIPLVSNGASSDPSFTTAVVAGGGTGQTNLTNHGVLIGAGTSAITQSSVGATGTVLAGNTGADPTFQTIAGLGGSLVLISSQTASTSANLTFNLSSSYNSYLLLLESVRPVTNGDNILMQVSTGSFITTGYSSGFNSNAYNSTSTTNTNLTTSTILANNVNNGGAPVGASGQYFLMNMTSGTQYNTITGECVINNGSSVFTTGRAFSTTGNFTACTQIKVFCTSSNILTGVVTLYGFRES